jgi:hypothetical protein
MFHPVLSCPNVVFTAPPTADDTGGRYAATRLFQPRPKRFSHGRGPAKPASDHAQQFRMKDVHPPLVAAEQPLPFLHILLTEISFEERLKRRRSHQPITQQE